MKKAKNELLEFLGGLAMLVAGLYIFSQKVMVSSSLFGGMGGAGMRFGSFHVSNGMIMIPFIIGIVWMFASGGSFASKVLTGAGVLFIILSIILSTNISLTQITLYEWILILVLIFGGAGLLVKVLFAVPQKDTDRNVMSDSISDSRQKMREIEQEIEKIKKGQ